MSEVDVRKSLHSEAESPEFEIFQAMAKMDLIPFSAVAETIRMAEVIVSDTLVNKLLEPIRNLNRGSNASMLRSQLSQSSAAEEIVDEPSGITFEQFEKILALARTKQPTEEILINALRPLEDQKIHEDGEIVHVIYADALREYLQEFGDVLSDDEMKEFLDEFCPGKKTEDTSILTEELVMQLMDMS